MKDSLLICDSGPVIIMDRISIQLYQSLLQKLEALSS